MVIDLDELWGLNFIGATSNSVEYDRNGVRSTGQNFGIFRL